MMGEYFLDGSQGGLPEELFCKDMKDEKEQVTWRYEYVVIFEEEASVSEKPEGANELDILERERLV